MKKTGHFDASQIDQSNQFIDQPFNKSRVSNNLAVDKNDIIRKLQAKNDKLKMEVDKVNSVLGYQMQNQANSAGGVNTNKRYGIRIPQLNKKVADKQLQNAYKMIKSYQYDIKKKQKQDEQGSYVQQIKKLEGILKQKQDLTQKLRKQIQQINKQSVQYIKLLKDDNLKNQYEAKSHKLHTQVKYLREKIIQCQNKLNSSSAQREKQKSYIDKLQRQLIKQGMPMNTIQSMKNRLLGGGQYMGTTDYNPNMGTTDQPIEERSPEIYHGYLGQIKLLRKVEKDHQNKIKQLQKDRQDMAEKNFQSRNQLLQVQHTIERLQSEIAELKLRIDPRNLKPTKAISMPKPAMKYDHLNKSTEKTKAAFTHIFKNQEMGQITRMGKRFTDRAAIGKKSAFVVGISYYENQTSEGQLLGFQATYMVGGALKKGFLNCLQKKKMPNPKTFRLQSGDHYKTLQIITGGNYGNIIGIILVSHKGQMAKGGNFNGNRKIYPIPPNQFPCCFYGSLVDNGIQLLGVQMTEE